jgi:Uma2 family endonuclease
MSLSEPSVLELGPRAAGLALSCAEFDAAEFEPGWRYELIQGVLVVNPAPSPQERGPNERLGNLLWDYQQNHELGAHLDDTLPEHDVHVGPLRRRADRVLWAGLGRQPRTDETPTVVVEFVSAGKRNLIRDYDQKRDEYARLGVREYWVINRFTRSMTVFRPQQPAQTVAEHDTYVSEFLPGFELKLTTPLAVADRWDV